MKSYPFDSKRVDGSWDRAITAQDERDFNKLYFTNGVFANPPSSLLVEAYSGMQIKVLPGGCHIEGAKAYSGEARYITLSNSASNLARIDRIIARYDNSEAVRSIDIYVREGVPSTTPIAPDIHTEPEYYEIVLADVLVPKGVTSIKASYIIDQRLNPELCGLVVPMAKDKDTSELWSQIRGSIELVNSALDGSTAAKLKATIGNSAPIGEYSAPPSFRKMTEQITSYTYMPKTVSDATDVLGGRVLDLKKQVDGLISEETLKAFESLGWERPGRING